MGTSRAEPDMIRFLVRGCLRNAARVARACKKCDIHSREGPSSTNSHSRKNHRRWKWKVGNGKVLIMNDTGKLVLRKPDDRAPADTSTLPKALDGNVGTSIINYVAHGKSAQRAIQKRFPNKHEGANTRASRAATASWAAAASRAVSTNQAQNVKSSNDRLLFIATCLRTSTEHSVLTMCRLHGESKYPVSSNLLTAL